MVIRVLRGHATASIKDVAPNMPELLNDRPRVPLLELPTPIQRLHRLEQALGDSAAGVRLYVKRDDLASIGGGGNKLRKLEFLLGEAVAQGCDTFLTTGGLQSNHARLSAAATARAGLSCELFLTHVVPRDDEEYRRNGNIMLDRLFGATIHELPGDANALYAAHTRAEELRQAGRRPYVVGMGGSSPVGCLGYAAAALELLDQEDALGESFARIIVPNGSGGTQAGLAAGFAAAGQDPARLLSFAVLATAEKALSDTLCLARDTIKAMGVTARLADNQMFVSGDQLGAGYGIPTAAMIEAVRLMARTEGLLLDPVYSGKAFAGMLSLLRQGAFPNGSAVLFMMTGGVPGLHAYRGVFEE
jgi:L-cysteate sulfo-lyase